LILGVTMAAAGPEVVPAAGRGGDPGWLEGLYGGGLGIDGGSYIHLERAALVAYAVVVVCARALPKRLLWGAIVALVLVFVAAPPLLSLDVFSYVSYARLEGLHGQNPYEFTPASVPGDEALAFVEDWRDSVSVYGPLFTIASAPLAHLGVGGAVWSLKLAAGIGVLLTAWIASRLAAARGVDPAFAAAVVALNPLVLVHVVGGAHNDALMAAVMTAGIAAIALGRQILGGLGLVAAAAVKASALLVVPFALIGADRRSRLVAGLVAAAVLTLGIGLLAFGSSFDQALKVVGQNQSIATRASLPGQVSRDLDLDIDAVRTVFLAGFTVVLAVLLAWCARGADWIRGAGWAAVGLLLATSYLTPWYVIWALPLAAVARDRALVAATVAVSAFLLRYQVPGLGG
jgi:alpha-1,6-mannosyltransferase